MAEQQEALRGAPPALAALHAQASELVGGERDAFERQVRELRGFPVVVNLWGSWCGPCRAEFPHFQREAVRLGKEVAFLGVNVTDPNEGAQRLLEDLPVSYPSYSDPNGEIASKRFRAVAYPTTVFLDGSGDVTYTKTGPYTSDQQLARDIARYAH